MLSGSLTFICTEELTTVVSEMWEIEHELNQITNMPSICQSLQLSDVSGIIVGKMPCFLLLAILHLATIAWFVVMMQA